jgi:hypothetical protein
MTGANHATLSFSFSIAASVGPGSKLRSMENSRVVPQHGDAGQVERADVVERTEHKQPRICIWPEYRRLVGRFPVSGCEPTNAGLIRMLSPI